MTIAFDFSTAWGDFPPVIDDGDFISLTYGKASKDGYLKLKTINLASERLAFDRNICSRLDVLKHLFDEVLKEAKDGEFYEQFSREFLEYVNNKCEKAGIRKGEEK